MRTSRLHLVAGGVLILLCDGDLIKPFSGSDPSHQTLGELIIFISNLGEHLNNVVRLSSGH